MEIYVILDLMYKSNIVTFLFNKNIEKCIIINVSKRGRAYMKYKMHREDSDYSSYNTKNGTYQGNSFSDIGIVHNLREILKNATVKAVAIVLSITVVVVALGYGFF
jgi:hypothetical protein